ncbi:MAG: hydrogenase maturation protease [Coriobacteriia bacterium]|nr:hydrogenase maturation protease [Coriobacteriia bacterium]
MQTKLQTNSRLLVLCVGNILLLDEGFGSRIAHELATNYRFPPNVSILDRGVMGMAMISDLRSANDVLIIDALDKTGEEPGTILSFSPDELQDYQVFRGAHDTRLIDILNAAELIGIKPPVTCLGVQVADISPPAFEIGLSPAVEAAVPLMVGQVLEWLASRGADAIAISDDDSCDMS